MNYFLQKILILFSFFIFLLFAQKSLGQVVVSAELDSNHMLIGDQMTLHLLVNHPNGFSISSPDMTVFEKSKIEVLHEASWDTLQEGVEFILEKNIVFTAWDSGLVNIPKIPIPYKQGSESGLISTDPLSLLVNVPARDSTLTPIKDIILEPRTFEDFIPALATILGFLVLAGVVYFFWNRKKRQPDPPPIKIKIPVHKIALKKLDLLKQKNLWQKGEVKAYQSELTHIIREYLEERFDIQALENTTYEILESLKKANLSNDWEKNLQEILQVADLVKFAKAKPPESFHEEVMTKAENFVSETQSVDRVKEVVQEDLLND